MRCILIFVVLWR